MSILMDSSISFEKLFYKALRIRKIEEKIIEIYPSDKIQSPVHLSIGQEHHIVALCASLSVGDKAFTTYRSHALYLAKGGDLKKMFAELYGKQEGISKGKAGSMHLCSPEVNLFGSSAIVGAVFSHALGMAYAEKNKGTSNISVCVAGEGATEEGTFHECLNMASVKKLPVLYLIENNGFAIHIPTAVRQGYSIQKLVDAYGIEYLKLNGFEIEQTYKALKNVVSSIRETSRPFVVEIDTYRYLQHVGIRMDYEEGYRDISEYNKWTEKDPLIQRVDLIEAFSEEIDNEIEAALSFAEKSKFPDRTELLKDVY